MKTFKRLSFLTLIVTCSILSVYRITTVNVKEISWDVLGYYLYLPATFVHHDPLLKDISWLKQLNDEKQLAGTLYMVGQDKNGGPMYFFLMGMALFYLPFFFGASLFASISGFPVDGFSLPYQYFLVIGGILYTIVRLIFLRKILLRFFSERLSSLIMILTVFGTNYINHLTLKNLETVNVLFMLTTIIIWNTIKLHENSNGRHLIIIGLSATLMTLIKPSEVVIILIPLLWNLTSFDGLKQKYRLLVANWKSLGLTIGICLLLVLPQLLYWHHATGHYIYDSYKNPGVGLDLTSPHIMNVLFSYRKGWLLYTPMMAFSLIGFYFLFKKNKQIFWASAVYFCVAFYIIASWTEWWYGAAFSIRPLISAYPILAICLGYLLLYIGRSNLVLKTIFGLLCAFFVFLNQFQWWQYKNYILDPYRTTKDYYWATFLKSSVNDNDRKLLLVQRDYTGRMEFTDPDNYQKSPLLNRDFEGVGDDQGNQVENGNCFYKLSEDQEYLPLLEKPYGEVTQKDHLWVKVSLDIRFPEGFEGSLPCLVNTIERSNGAYGYYTTEIKVDSMPNQWRKIETMYLTPEIRSSNDRLKCYLWKRSKSPFDVDNVSIEIFTKKN